MSQEELKELFVRTKEFSKDKNFTVITPCALRATSSTKPVGREVPAVIFIDYLSTLGTH
jgi:hypothetical protein